jgi:RNA recognition motif-containing protein
MNNPTKRLFVGSLPYSMTEGQLLELFVQFGRIVSLKIMHTPWGKSRGLGFVEFETLDQAIEAKTKMHNYALTDRSIIVDYAQEDPAKTREGQERHQQAVARRPQKFQSFEPTAHLPHPDSDQKDSRPPHKEYKHSFSKSPENFEHKRQSVYDAKHHHAGVGKKFASRRKSK